MNVEQCMQYCEDGTLHDVLPGVADRVPDDEAMMIASMVDSVHEGSEMWRFRRDNHIVQIIQRAPDGRVLQAQFITAVQHDS